MPGRTPAEAARAFLEPLQLALSCVAHAKITTSPGGLGQAACVHWWSINAGEGVSVSTGHQLRAQMWFELVEEEGHRGPWRATTHGYAYSVHDYEGRELLAAHWHPLSPSAHVEPHLHLPAKVLSAEGVFLAQEPLYTGRFTFEALIRFAVKNLGASPLCEDWNDRLTLAEAPHQLYRSWHQTPAEVPPKEQDDATAPRP